MSAIYALLKMILWLVNVITFKVNHKLFAAIIVGSNKLILLQMEVTAISIWTTTFTKVDKTGTTEVVIYPNSELANKVIINHKTKFDWSDCLQFCLGSAGKIDFNIENNIDNV